LPKDTKNRGIPLFCESSHLAPAIFTFGTHHEL